MERDKFLRVARIVTSSDDSIEIAQTNDPTRHALRIDGGFVELDLRAFEALKDVLYHIGPPEAEEPEKDEDEVPF